MPDFGARLEEVIDEDTRSRAEISRDSGVSDKTLQRWMGSSDPPSMSRKDTRKNVQALCSELGISKEWLLDGEGAKRSSSVSAQDDRKQVRHFGPASAGDGRTLQPVGTVEMTEGEYRARFGSRSVDHVGLFEVEGDSAAPVYFDGEHVPVEVEGDTQDFQEDTVYVFRYRDDIMIKRLRTLKDGRVRAESLNPGIDNRILEPNGHEFEIVGRVIDNPKQQLYTSMVSRFMREKGQE